MLRFKIQNQGLQTRLDFWERSLFKLLILFNMMLIRYKRINTISWWNGTQTVVIVWMETSGFEFTTLALFELSGTACLISVSGRWLLCIPIVWTCSAPTTPIIAGTNCRIHGVIDSQGKQSNTRTETTVTLNLLSRWLVSANSLFGFKMVIRSRLALLVGIGSGVGKVRTLRVNGLSGN